MIGMVGIEDVRQRMACATAVDLRQATRTAIDARQARTRYRSMPSLVEHAAKIPLERTLCVCIRQYRGNIEVSARPVNTGIARSAGGCGAKQGSQTCPVRFRGEPPLEQQRELTLRWACKGIVYCVRGHNHCRPQQGAKRGIPWVQKKCHLAGRCHLQPMSPVWITNIGFINKAEGRTRLQHTVGCIASCPRSQFAAARSIREKIRGPDRFPPPRARESHPIQKNYDSRISVLRKSCSRSQLF